MMLSFQLQQGEETKAGCSTRVSEIYSLGIGHSIYPLLSFLQEVPSIRS